MTAIAVYGAFQFGQRNNMGETKHFTDPAEYFECILNPAHIVKRIEIISDKMVAVDFCKWSEYVEALPNTNPVIASLVTAQARLKLYTYLEQLEDRVLYYDTGKFHIGPDW